MDHPILIIQFYSNTKALIWVIGSTDRERVTSQSHDETNSCDESHSMLDEPQLKNVKLLIFVNTSDFGNAMELKEVMERLKVIVITQEWIAIQTSTVTMKGLYEGIGWLAMKLYGKNDPPCYGLNEGTNLYSGKNYNMRIERKQRINVL